MTMITDASATPYVWTKSSYSGGQNDCVEVAHGAVSGAMPVRDSKVPAGPALLVRGDAWAQFLAGVTTGELA